MVAKTSKKTIATAVAELLESGQNSTQVARNLAAYLVEERRSSELDAILREVSRIRRERSGVVEISARSVFPVDAEAKRAVARLFGAEKAVFNDQTDASLIGGAVFESADAQLDLSFRRQINQLKHVSA